MKGLASPVLMGSLLLCLVACASSPSAQITYAGAMAKYYKSDYVGAAHDFQVLARQGDSRSKIQLASMYAAGLGGPVDYVSAQALFKEVALQGDPLAQGLLGDLLMDDYHDYQGAFEWYSKSAAQGYPYAYPSLWYMYKNGLGTQRDPAKAAEYYALSADKGAPQMRFFRLAMDDAVESSKRYPPEAVADKAQGVVTISFEYYGGGKAMRAEVSLSSGDKRLDEAALRAVQEAEFPEVPPEFASAHRFILDVSFSLN